MKKPEVLHPRAPTMHKSIILDGIHPTEWRELNIMFCCEQCSYFDGQKKTCAMGFKVHKHMREPQLALYHLTGKMAICRSQEID